MAKDLQGMRWERLLLVSNLFETCIERISYEDCWFE